MKSVFSRPMITRLASLIFALAACSGDGPTVEEPPAQVAASPPPPPRAETPAAPSAPPPVAIAMPTVVPPAPEVAPDSAAAALAQAHERARLGDGVGATELLAAAAATWPRDAEVHVELARRMLGEGNAGGARVHAERATELRPTWSTAWNTLGRAELASGDDENAIVSFQTAVEANQDNVHAWNNLGLTLMRTRQWPDAVDALERAVDAAQVEPYMWNNLGMAYEHLDRIREARAAYRQAAGLGSAKGSDNMSRLEGVRSLTPAAVATVIETGPDSIEGLPVE